jgi:hypothetical protein
MPRRAALASRRARFLDEHATELRTGRTKAIEGVSARYFKQVMLISEVNGRISELRGKGCVIETSGEGPL